MAVFFYLNQTNEALLTVFRKRICKLHAPEPAVPGNLLTINKR